MCRKVRFIIDIEAGQDIGYGSGGVQRESSGLVQQNIMYQPYYALFRRS